MYRYQNGDGERNVEENAFFFFFFQAVTIMGVDYDVGVSVCTVYRLIRCKLKIMLPEMVLREASMMVGFFFVDSFGLFLIFFFLRLPLLMKILFQSNIIFFFTS